MNKAFNSSLEIIVYFRTYCHSIEIIRRENCLFFFSSIIIFYLFYLLLWCLMHHYFFLFFNKGIIENLITNAFHNISQESTIKFYWPEIYIQPHIIIRKHRNIKSCNAIFNLENKISHKWLLLRINTIVEEVHPRVEYEYWFE